MMAAHHASRTPNTPVTAKTWDNLPFPPLLRLLNLAFDLNSHQ